MSSKRNAFCFLMLAFLIGIGGAAFAQPIFENKTPTGFSSADSTRQERFITDTDVTVLVDLNEAANATYPVIGNFQKLEKSVPYFSSGSNAGYMSQAVAVDDNGVIHRAWIQQRGFVRQNDSASSPAYGVVYAKSFDGGKTFTDTVGVSGTMRFDMMTTNLAMTGAFSTVDLVVDSKGNPRVTYAFDFSADDFAHHEQVKTIAGTGARTFEGVFFNYSNDGGSSWLPSNNTVTISDTSLVGTTSARTDYPGRNAAFPRMAITSTDDIYIVYQRGVPAIGVGNDTDTDIMLAKMDADSLLLGTAQQVLVGGTGTIGSMGGVFIGDNDVAEVSPDIAVGDDDVLHVTWFVPGASATAPIRYKSVPSEDWNNVGATGWNQDTDVGAQVGTFDTRTAGQNIGLSTSPGAAGLVFNQGVTDHMHLFPTVVVDTERTPDRVYVFWKHTDAILANPYTDENIRYGFYDYDGLVGGLSTWSSVSDAFPTGHDGSNPKPATAAGLFQNAAMHQIEDNWAYVDRVTAVADGRIPGTRGDIHIVFSAGDSHGFDNAAAGNANAIYYSRFNGTEWELPQVVATQANGTSDGVLATHKQLFGPDIAITPGSENVFLTYVGGAGGNGVQNKVGSTTTGDGSSTDASGVGLAGLYTNDILPLPYFKVLGRVSTFEDKSVPVGAFQYQLSYNPMNPQDGGTNDVNNLVQVTVADNVNGTGIGGSTPGSSAAPGGFLTGQWQSIGFTTLGVTSLNPGEAGAVFKGANSQSQAINDNGVFEGQTDESGSAGFAEWGDDGDKVGLLVKMNVLGSDSSTNVLVIGSSSSAVGPGGTGGEVVADSSTQSISVQHEVGKGPASSSFVEGVRRNVAAGAYNATVYNARVAASGSYFVIGADIDIIAANSAPSVSVLTPDASTISTGSFANETFTIRYTLFDSDDNSTDTDSDTLRAALYAYPDNGLRNVQDIKTFATLLVDERDVAGATTRAATDPTATDDFVEGATASATQAYVWDDPGTTYQTSFGWAPVTKTLDGTYYIYIVADDGVNPAVYAVSGGALRVRHIPIVRTVAPVAADTVDTGEYSNLAKANPYKVQFTVVDYDDNAQVRLFYATSNSLESSNVTVTGTYPNQTLELAGATAIQLSDSLRSDEDVEFDFNVAAQGVNRDEVVAQGNYFLYAVAADDDTFAVSVSSNALAVRHSPSFEFTAPLKGMTLPLDPSQQDVYTIEWQRGRSDKDLDGNAIISLYYTGVDPKSVNYSGTDSTRLVATSGTNPGNAVLIVGNIREDDEGENDQYVWDFRNPPSALP
ncbi:MAG: hypothetical protein VX792_10785, partial [Candidatus Latescibacterota bacterium]|nr:hypothetical protein [Candidatus Latescibacterota bacterium]